MALFVLAIVGLVVAQTWLDWRDTKRNWTIPEWAKGVALAGLIAVSMTAATSYASVWLEDASGSSSGPSLFWPELGLALCAMGIMVAAVRKKRLRIMFVLAILFAICLWLGMTFSS